MSSSADWAFGARREGDRVELVLTIQPDGAATPTTLTLLVTLEQARAVARQIEAAAGTAFHSPLRLKAAPAGEGRR